MEVEIIGIEGEKLSLSMKRLIPDPWSVIEEKYPIGSKVSGTINRFSPFGAFVQLEDDINGLIHLSEISDQKVEDPSDFLEVGQEVEAVVINIDRDEHRIGLSLKGAGSAAKKKASSKKEEVSEEEVSEEKPKKKVAKKKEDEGEEATEEKPKKKAAKKKED